MIPVPCLASVRCRRTTICRRCWRARWAAAIVSPALFAEMPVSVERPLPAAADREVIALDQDRAASIRRLAAGQRFRRFSGYRSRRRRGRARWRNRRNRISKATSAAWRRSTAVRVDRMEQMQEFKF